MAQLQQCTMPKGTRVLCSGDGSAGKRHYRKSPHTLITITPRTSIQSCATVLPPPPLVKFRTAATRKNERRQTFTKCQLAAATQNLMATQWAVFTDKTAPPTNKGKAKQRIRLILILKNAKILECLIIEKEGSYQLSCFLAFFCCTDAKVSSAGWGAASDTILRRLS